MGFFAQLVIAHVVLAVLALSLIQFGPWPTMIVFVSACVLTMGTYVVVWGLEE